MAKIIGWSAVFFLCFPVTAWTEVALTPYRASPDQVLVLYNADYPYKSDGASAGDDSREVAEYYVKMHTDPVTGKKPWLLGLTCKHLMRRHLNDWFIKEDSNDNANGVTFHGKGKPPEDLNWVRDSRNVEFRLDPETDWDSVRITCHSDITGQEAAITPLRVGLKISGIPDTMKGAVYKPVQEGKGRTYRFNATEFFSGSVTVRISARDKKGKLIRDLSVPYYDIRDFAFTPVGADGIADDAILEEDVLQPVRAFLEDPANALPDGTSLRNHILYIVVVKGMPYSAKAVFGIEHGATSIKSDHGSLASLEQRLQTIYYPWMQSRPPLGSFFITGGPDADKGIVNHIITTAMRRSLTGSRWNPYMHPDTYSFLRKDAPPPVFKDLPPLAEQRRSGNTPFAYGVTRIDGATAEEAKRIIDYAVYASRYLRPEMDCRVRADLRKRKGKKQLDLAERLKQSETAWGNRELERLGFGRKENFNDEGLPFLVRSSNDGGDDCAAGEREWQKAGFYPGGIERNVTSSNGLNYKEADIWKQLGKGVSVSAAGAPAYSGGPHITNASFWDNRILLKYLLRGRDLGEALLRSTFYVNWSTSLIGDPLFHPDLRETIVDRTPPRPAAPPSLKFTAGLSSAEAHIGVELSDSPDDPEVALLRVTARDDEGHQTTAVSPLYSRRPRVTVGNLKPGVSYHFSGVLIDPYGNRSQLPPFSGKSSTADTGRTFLKRFLDYNSKE